MAKNKTRLDVALVEQGFAESREKAKAIIMSGIVYVNNQKSDKAGKDVKDDDVIEVRETPPITSRREKTSYGNHSQMSQQPE